MSSTYAVIMAGGRGERFWPLSTDRTPKPFVPLLGPRTLIQQTVDRLTSFLPADRIFVSIGEEHRGIAVAQLPNIPTGNFIVEPVGRDTAACLGFCALHLERRDADGTMLALPADHFVADDEAYRRTIEKGLTALPGATGVVFGVRPVRPETGYGYIQVQRPATHAKFLPVMRFVEKPDVERARHYLEEGSYYWNSGMFLWRNRTLLDLLREHMPELHRGMEALRPMLGDPAAAPERSRVFAALPRISIDFGVMEKTSGLRLVPVDFGWDDIGNWEALARALPADVEGNIALGLHAAADARRCITYSDAGTVAVFGVSDLIVVQANGRVLVCSRDHAAELKRLVAALIPKQTGAGLP